MKKDSKNMGKALDVISNGWAMARILSEHGRATTSPLGFQGLDPREFLVVKLVEKFPGHVSQKLITILFGIQFGQQAKL